MTAFLFAITGSVVALPTQEPAQDEGVRALSLGIERYVALRRQLDPIAAPLHSNIPAAVISAHRQELARLVAEARANARRGHILNSKVERYIREIIRTEYPGSAVEQLRNIVTDDDTQPVLRLRVNAPIPDEQGTAIMPPRLLARLPVLPEELEYRFVSRHFVLRDTETGLIVDYIYNVVP